MITSAKCTQCGHAWTTRKSPDEIDRPRCSECGAEREAITFGDETGESADGTDLDIVERAKRERRLYELRERVSELLERLEGTAAEGSEHEVAREVRGAYRELTSLAQHLDDVGAGDSSPPSLDELEDVDYRVDVLEEEIAEHADELDTIDDLTTTVSELRSERKDLQESVADLRNERVDFETELEDLKSKMKDERRVLDRIEDKEEAFQRGVNLGERWGLQNAREWYEIQIPCINCGQSMTLRPGSEMHERAIFLLQQEGWSHNTCPSQQQYPPVPPR